MRDIDRFVETERLRLRPHRADDLAGCAALWADPVVVRYIGGKAATESEAWHKMLRYAGMWSLVGYGYWAIEEKSAGEFIGELGFADFLRTIEPSIRGVPELGWALAPRAHGKGYGTEAVRAALAWGDAHLPADRTVCLIGPDNVTSLRLAERCGFRETHRTMLGAEQAVLLEHRFARGDADAGARR